MRHELLIITASACLVFAGPSVAVQATCGAVEHLRDGETVDQLAARCDVSVDALLKANNVDTADQLSSHDAIAVPVETVGDDWLERARAAVKEAGRQVNEAATAAGRSVSDYLKDQPDLNREVLSFGEKLGLPGVEAQPSTGPKLDVEAEGADRLNVSAAGLPGDREVVFGWLDADTVKTLETLRTDESGRVSASLLRSDDIPQSRRVMFVIETSDKKLRLAADPIEPY